jgi:hypothetical protein
MLPYAMAAPDSICPEAPVIPIVSHRPLSALHQTFDVKLLPCLYASIYAIFVYFLSLI